MQKPVKHTLAYDILLHFIVHKFFVFFVLFCVTS